MTTRIARRRVAAADLERLPAHLPPVLRRIYAARGVHSGEELEYGLEGLLPFTPLKGVAEAAALLAETLERGRPIVVVGDFDADGATGTALVVRALRMMGASRVDYLVPRRESGYGLTPELVASAAKSRPGLLITVDNGVTSFEGVAAARAAGIAVLVTDHHLPGAELPAADALVNPNQSDCPFPSKALAGVGVAFYLMLALRARLREVGWFTRRGLPEPNMASLLDLVALGTVADVVPLDRNNRLLVEQGLRRIRAGRAAPGILALLEVAGRDHRRTVAGDLGFAVGPRLNAAGRLDDMRLGIECLLDDDPARARGAAARLHQLNLERREIEAEMKEQALELLQRLHLEEAEGLPVGLCLYDEGWHPGVVGILAARIKERLHRPVIAFARSGEGEVKGSARSVAGVHIRDVLEEVTALHPGLIERFGGHAMAAGLTLRTERLDRFRAAFDAQVRRHLDRDALHGVLHSDGELAAAELTLETAHLLRAGGPWGQSFPEPLFDGEFEVLHWRSLNDRHIKGVLRLGEAELDAIAFNVGPAEWPESWQRVRLAYRLDVNEFRGRESAQLVVEYLERA